jgi:hypothetical protein
MDPSSRQAPTMQSAAAQAQLARADRSSIYRPTCEQRKNARDLTFHFLCRQGWARAMPSLQKLPPVWCAKLCLGERWPAGVSVVNTFPLNSGKVSAEQRQPLVFFALLRAAEIRRQNSSITLARFLHILLSMNPGSLAIKKIFTSDTDA